MGIIHRYAGDFTWEGVEKIDYAGLKDFQGVSGVRLIGPADHAPNFIWRYFEVEAEGRTSLDQHPHEHGVVVQRGQGQVLFTDEWHDIGPGDVVFVPGDEVHQFRNTGPEPFGFFCVIPAKRPDST